MRAGVICEVEAWTIAVDVVVVEGAALRMKVEVVVLDLLWELTAANEETGMLTTVPGCPLGMDMAGWSWMRTGWPWPTMLVP